MGLLQRVRSALQRVRGEPAVSCTHLDQIYDVTPQSTGCAECLELCLQLGASANVHDRRARSAAATLRRTNTPAATPASTHQSIRSPARWSATRTGCGLHGRGVRVASRTEGLAPDLTLLRRCASCWCGSAAESTRRRQVR